MDALWTSTDWGWVLLFLALVGAWVVLRFLLRLTVKVFFVGCSTLFVLALIVFVLRLLGVM